MDIKTPEEYRERAERRGMTLEEYIEYKQEIYSSLLESSSDSENED